MQLTEERKSVGREATDRGFITLREAAARTGLNKATIWRYATVKRSLRTIEADNGFGSGKMILVSADDVARLKEAEGKRRALLNYPPAA